MLASILMLLTACPEMAYKEAFTFYNNSTYDVYVHLEFARELFSDTIPIPLDYTFANRTFGPIKKNEYKRYSYNKIPDTDTLYFFILDADTINNSYRILQRYNLAVHPEELHKLNYKITYPPSEDMKDIKMYPLYSED